MATIQRARILFWEGACLWILHVTPEDADDGAQGTFHSHHALQITFALDGSFELRASDLEVRSTVVAVAPDAQHAIRSSGTVAFLYVDPESQAGRAAVGRLFSNRPLAPVDAAIFGGLPGELLKAYQDRSATDEELIAIGRRLVRRLAGDTALPTLDPRVDSVIAWAAANLETTLRLADAAAVAGLSPDRFRHVFVNHTGLPFRTFVLWLRLLNAVRAFSRGESLTGAAHAAGFSDSAHLSRTFRRTFGIAAAQLQMH